MATKKPNYSNVINDTSLSKKDRATALYHDVTSAPAPEGTSHRRIFIDRAVAEIAMTPAGANTYFQNIGNALANPDVAPARLSTARRARSQATLDKQLGALRTKVDSMSKDIDKLAQALATAADAA